MFEFLFQNRKGEIEDLLQYITLNMNKIQMAALAKEKAESMIAKAIAKSEIVVSTGTERRTDEAYFRLNIRPNDNETGTDFWFKAVKTLLEEGECLIVRLNGKYYRAESFQKDKFVLMSKTYTNVTVTDGYDSVSLQRPFRSDEVLHLRYSSDKMRMFTDNVLRTYNDTLSALNSIQQMKNTPKFKYKIDANMSFREKDANGADKKLTVNDVIRRLTEQLTSTDIVVMKETAGTSLEYLDVKATASTADIKNMSAEINAACAMAYDIPESVFGGTITEKSDATNEFITYAVSPVAEIISDTLNGKIVGQEDYEKGERCFVWLAHFKHKDVIDAAGQLDKLRSIGFTLDEIREMVGYEALHTDFSTERALTKNYQAEGEEGAGSTDPADDPEESVIVSNQKASKHKERRKKRYGQNEILPAGD